MANKFHLNFNCRQSKFIYNKRGLRFNKHFYNNINSISQLQHSNDSININYLLNNKCM